MTSHRLGNTAHTAIMAPAIAAATNAELLELKQRHQVIAHEIARAVASRPDPVIIKTYRDHVNELVETFGRDIRRAETFETLCSIIGSVVLRPGKDRSALLVEIEQTPSSPRR